MKMDCYKILLVGNAEKEQMAMLFSYPNGKLLEAHDNLPDVQAKKIMVGGVERDAVLWNMLGHDFHGMRHFLRCLQTDVIILVYNAGNRAAFKNISENWEPEVKYFCPDVPIVVVGLLDLNSGNQTLVARKEGERLARAMEARRFIQCGWDVQDLKLIFEEAIRAAIIARNKKKPKRNCTII